MALTSIIIIINVPNVRRSPSYYRRQERRKAARAAEQPSTKDAVATEKVNNGDSESNKDIAVEGK